MAWMPCKIKPELRIAGEVAFADRWPSGPATRPGSHCGRRRNRRSIDATTSGRPAAASRLPASAGIAGSKDPARKHGRGAADGPTPPLGQEADLSQGRQQHRFPLPIQPAVPGAEHDPGAIVQIGIGHAARGPAVAGIDETYRASAYRPRRRPAATNVDRRRRYARSRQNRRRPSPAAGRQTRRRASRASTGWSQRAGGSALWESGGPYSGARILRFGRDGAVSPGGGAYGNWAIGSAANKKHRDRSGHT